MNGCVQWIASHKNTPLAASINHAAGNFINNRLIIQSPNTLAASGFILHTFVGSHYVGDIVGDFAPPVATALQCVGTDWIMAVSGAGVKTWLSAPACPVAYQATTPYVGARSPPQRGRAHIPAQAPVP